MSLHPDDRPESIEVFNNYLFANGEIRPGTRSPDSAIEIPRLDLFGSPADTILVWAAAGLLLLSLLATLLR
jgi:hypothetical protein